MLLLLYYRANIFSVPTFYTYPLFIVLVIPWDTSLFLDYKMFEKFNLYFVIDCVVSKAKTIKERQSTCYMWVFSEDLR